MVSQSARSIRKLSRADMDALNALVGADSTQSTQDLGMCLMAALLFEAKGRWNLVRDVAAQVAFEQLEVIRTHLGGESLYICKEQIRGARRRAAAIRRDFNGHNAKALAQRHGISRERVRQILADLQSNSKDTSR